MQNDSANISINNIFKNERALLGLALIQKNKQLSIENLQGHLGVKESAISNIVTLLVKNNLVVFDSNKLSCTNKGIQLIESSFPNLYKHHPDYYTIPFGYAAAEVEEGSIKELMVRPRFFEAALSDHASIIVGRRGSGKTFIAKYLASNPNDSFGDVITIDTQNALAVITNIIGEFDNNAEGLWIGEAAWSFYIWVQIFFCLSKRADFKQSSLSKPIFLFLKQLDFPKEKIEKSLSSMCYSLLTFLKKKDNNFIVDLANSSEFINAINYSEKYIKKINGLLIVIDTLERYNIRDKQTEIIVSSLIWTSLKFSQRNSPLIQIKCFVRSEVFNLITVSSLPNPAKTFAHTVYLRWTPKDLTQLINKRLNFFHNKISHHKVLNQNIPSEKIPNNQQEIWNKYFPNEICNPLFKMKEPSLVYFLRHTQLEPRHVLLSLNTIARDSVEDNTFPLFTEKNFIMGVQQFSLMLTKELLNAYEDIYPNIGSIISVFVGESNMFEGSFLDRIAPRSKKLWPDNMPYDRFLFRQMLCELGFIGKVFQKTNKYIESIFEYGLSDHLRIDSTDECVIHPIFYENYNIKVSSKKIIYPRSVSH